MASAFNLPVLSLSKSPNFTINPSTRFLQRDFHAGSFTTISKSKSYRKRAVIVCVLPLGVDPWAPSIDSQSIASQLFAFSLFPYIGFLYFITKSKTSPNLTLFGFYFLLAFVGATIPAGIYAKVHYGTSLSNVDWLHGGAESLLTLTNLFIVLGLREGIRKAGNSEKNTGSEEEK
ncbi:1-acyl-sn-glycerol-3-phosphate acyltransferase [Trifolium repens]|nr:1-acyl-sn-glycerol-3-phosphate acyltransferase [Trifolium repens]